MNNNYISPSVHGAVFTGHQAFVVDTNPHPPDHSDKLDHSNKTIYMQVKVYRNIGQYFLLEVDNDEIWQE